MDKPTWYATQVYEGKTYETVEEPVDSICADCAFFAIDCKPVSKGCNTEYFIWKELK